MGIWQIKTINKMNIALLGYGRMGQTIEQIAIKRGHTIVLKVDKDEILVFLLWPTEIFQTA